MLSSKIYICLRPTIRLFAVYLRSDSMAFGGINHDLVVDLCSELLIRLSYYIHTACGDGENWSPRENRTQDILIVSCTSPTFTTTTTTLG